MVLTVLSFVVLFICVFCFAYELAMYKICGYVLEAMTAVDVDNSDQRFLDGVYFIADYLEKKV